ncbi:MAG: hypothetical protein HMLKMBBP_01527 [Planctomycetes bacterium]|nr:hypothetical protein [Planctomycetota bacterium]
MSTQALKAAIAGEPAESADPVRRLFATLDGKRNEIASLLPRTIDVQQFVGVCKTAVLNDPMIAQADPRTFFIACMLAAKDGLLPDGKEAVLNVYNTKVKDSEGRDRWIKKVQYLPMAGGMIKKLYGCGEVTYVDAAAVYERDHFEYERGDQTRLVHRPFLGDDPGPVVAAYAVVKLANGEIKREVMPRRDIEKVRAASKAAEGPGWTTWYDQFAIKSVVKRAYKQLPHTKELDQIIEHDNQALGFTAQSDSVTAALTGQAAPAIEDKTEEAQETGKDLLGDETGPVTVTSLLAQVEAAQDTDSLNLCRDLLRELKNKTEKQRVIEALAAKTEALQATA